MNISRGLRGFFSFVCTCTIIIVLGYPLSVHTASFTGGVAMLCLLLLNPYLSQVLSQRPLYFEDVLSDSADGRVVIFSRGVAFSTALGFALCIEYSGLNRERSLSETAAVVGGIISFVRRIHVMIAKGMLLVCASCKNTLLRKPPSPVSGVELTAV